MRKVGSHHHQSQLGSISHLVDSYSNFSQSGLKEITNLIFVESVGMWTSMPKRLLVTSCVLDMVGRALRNLSVAAACAESEYLT